jgi:hypothetical protein
MNAALDAYERAILVQPPPPPPPEPEQMIVNPVVPPHVRAWFASLAQKI